MLASARAHKKVSLGHMECRKAANERKKPAGQHWKQRGVCRMSGAGVVAVPPEALHLGSRGRKGAERHLLQALWQRRSSQMKELAFAEWSRPYFAMSMFFGGEQEGEQSNAKEGT